MHMLRDPQINLYVADIEASQRFYRDLCGFTEVFRTPQEGEPIHVEMRLGGLILGVATMDSARQLHGLSMDAGPPRAEVVLWTDDVDGVYQRKTASGARALSEPHDFLSNLRSAWVADPDGNPVQLVMRRSS
jgi:catechol 2,3-dioxygenase-like lactoylglutathione lyase family enzyme